MENPKNKYWSIHQKFFDEVKEEIEKKIHGIPKADRMEVFNDCLISLFNENILFLEKELAVSNPRVPDILSLLAVRLNFLNQKILRLRSKMNLEKRI